LGGVIDFFNRLKQFLYNEGGVTPALTNLFHMETLVLHSGNTFELLSRQQLVDLEIDRGCGDPFTLAILFIEENWPMGRVVPDNVVNFLVDLIVDWNVIREALNS